MQDGKNERTNKESWGFSAYGFWKAEFHNIFHPLQFLISCLALTMTFFSWNKLSHTVRKENPKKRPKQMWKIAVLDKLVIKTY